jgi:hypothetical protein
MKNKDLKPHQLLGFNTQKAAIQAFREMLRGLAPMNQPLLHKLVALHPSAEAKIGTGIEYVFVAGAFYGSRCFHIRRTDGTRADFSYMKCLRGLKNNEAAQ